MKITLKNFRCHIDGTFVFEDKGINLISGLSGKGKSSIMMAILFVLFDHGKKLVTHGQKHCKVILELSNLKITRTKSPCHLILEKIDTNERYEDDSAQAIINSTFGKSFIETSYVQQGAYNSFILKSPSDKLLFLEENAFQGTNLSSIKSQVSSLLRNTNDTLRNTAGKRETTQEYFNKTEKPTKVDFPLSSKKTKESRDKSIEKFQIKKKNTEILIKRTQKAIDLLLQKQLSFESSKKKRIELANSIELLSKELQIVHEKLEKANIIDNESELYSDLQELSRRDRRKTLSERLEKDEKQLLDMKEYEGEKLRKDIDAIKSNLWIKETKENIQSAISDATDQCNATKEHTSLLYKLGEAKESLSKIDRTDSPKAKEELNTALSEYEIAKLQAESYECPHCNSKLRFENKRLVSLGQSPPDKSMDIDTLKKRISQLQKEIEINNKNSLKYETLKKQIENYEKQIEDLKGYYGDIYNLEESVEYLTSLKKYFEEESIKERELLRLLQSSSTLSPTFVILEKQISEYKRELNLFTISDKVILKTKDELSEELSKLRENKAVMRELSNQKESIQKKLELNRKELERYPNEDLTELSLEIEKNRESLKELEKSRVESEEISIKLSQYFSYEEKKKKYDELKDDLDILIEKEKKLEEEYKSILEFKELILQSESISLENIINLINFNVREYIDLFFIDPMLITLKPFKDCKNGDKPVINLEIDYKGSSIDINSLSGGELARVILAYTLAFSEIFHSPMILLDESLASLDQETTSIVMDGIRKNFSEHLILIIAHQVVTGEFDSHTQI